MNQADLDAALSSLEAALSGLESTATSLETIATQLQTDVSALVAKAPADLTPEVDRINAALKALGDLSVALSGSFQTLKTTDEEVAPPAPTPDSPAV